MKRTALNRGTPLKAQKGLAKKTPLRKRARSQSDTKKLHTKLWKTFSEYVRRRDNGVCYTCGVQKEWKEMQAGHYIHNVLDFDEENVHCQCVKCNHYLSGNATEYAYRLIQEIGLDRYNALHIRASRALAGERHEKEWYEERISYYKQLLVNL